MKPLSIIVPTFNEEFYLQRLLQSIVNASKVYEPAIQVIIVDGRSTDRTRAAVKRFQGLIPNLEIYSSKRGISVQRNFGARKAMYEALIFCDADMEFSKSSFTDIGKRIAKKVDYIGMPLIYPYDGKPIDFILGTISYVYFFAVQGFSPIICGMCIITTKTSHNRIRGFDEAITHAEDIDYGLRATKEGTKHYVFLGVKVRTSARRLDKDGRISTGLTWLRWHQKARKNRESLFRPEDGYEFGKFNRF